MNVPFLDLSLQHDALMPALAAAMAGVVERSAFVGGSDVTAFEEQFAAYCEARWCAAVANGTDALAMALSAVGVGEGDEVVTVASTFAATVEAILHCGARPVFVDVDPATCTMDPDQLGQAVTGRTKAVVPVHLFGQSADMRTISNMARKHGLAIVEDACQAHGARHAGRAVGSFADAACYSFYPSKNLGAFGDAGAVVTNRRDVYERVQQLKDHGQQGRGNHVALGRNSRMDSLQAAVLSVKLPHLDRWNERRRQWAACYDELLRDAPLVRPVVSPGNEHVFHLYVVRVAGRDAVLERMKTCGVTCGIHYPVPVHRQPFCNQTVSLPGSEQCAREFLSLPMHPDLTREQVEHVASSLTGCLDALEASFCHA